MFFFLLLIMDLSCWLVALQQHCTILRHFPFLSFCLCDSHAVRHFEASDHRYSVEIENQYIWDYQGDGYIHRLRGPRQYSETTTMDSSDNEIVSAKLQSISQYYNHLLSSQLTEQFNYFQGRMDSLQSTHDHQLLTTAQDTEAMNKEQAELALKVEELEKSARLVEKKVTQLQSQLKETKQSTDFLRCLNTSLLDDQKQMREQERKAATTSSSDTAKKESESGKKKDSENAKKQQRFERMLQERDRKIEALNREVAQLMQQMEAGSSSSSDAKK